MDILTAPLVDLGGVVLTRAEAIGSLAAVAALGLAARRDLLTFPAAMLAHSVSLLLMAGIGAYFQAVLQAAFIVLAVQGWWIWSRSRAADGRVVVGRMGQVELIVYPVVALLAVGPILLLYMRGGFVGGVGSALLLTGGVAAQLALNFRRMESWIIRILVDMVALPLFVSYGAWVAAAFHILFIAISKAGWTGDAFWRRTLTRLRSASSDRVSRNLTACRHRVSG